MDSDGSCLNRLVVGGGMLRILGGFFWWIKEEMKRAKPTNHKSTSKI